MASCPKANNGTTNERLLCGSDRGYPGSIRGMSSRGSPPTAIKRLAASVRCNISSITTLLMSSTASRLLPDLIQYSAQRYGGIVACSNSIAHCRCSLRLATEVIDAGAVKVFVLPDENSSTAVSISIVDVESVLLI